MVSDLIGAGGFILSLVVALFIFLFAFLMVRALHSSLCVSMKDDDRRIRKILLEILAIDKFALTKGIDLDAKEIKNFQDKLDEEVVKDFFDKKVRGVKSE